jgi:glycine/D-amino acid oxidase-like deaminating enzyme
VQLSFEIWRCTYGFWKVDRPDLYTHKKAPIWIFFDKHDHFYGFPSYEKEGSFKASIHFSNVILDDPNVNDHEPSKELMTKVKHFVTDTFDHVSKPIIPLDQTTCLYTVTSDENFVLDYHPDDKNIVIFAGGSGHAFKFGPVLGEILGSLLYNKKVEYDLSLFSIERLQSGKLKKGPSMLKRDIESKL